MDRFIEQAISAVAVKVSSLKSNMDRFIAIGEFFDNIQLQSLKSNMDRFIDFSTNGRLLVK